MNEYTVFISYKHSIKGKLTEDYAIAKSLYEELSKQNIKTFFSDKIMLRMGGDYKKVIDSALEQASLLIVVATEKEYITDGWVEYEYETFYEDILSGRKRGSIISFTKNIPFNELPRTLSRMQNYSITDLLITDFVQYIGTIIQNISIKTSDKFHTQNNAIRVSDYREHKGSVYESDYMHEINRLKIQAQNAREIDREALEYVYNNLPEKEKLCVLDIGSAYGFVAEDRFANDPRIDKIICLDYNKKVIERAKILFAEKENMIFEVIDVESGDFRTKLKDIMELYDIKKIHIIFSALTLHHLKDPKKLLRTLRKIMEKDTYVVLRGSDDGSKLCYPHYDLMKKIIDMTMSARGVSDRFNGRKIYTQLINTGFRNIKMLSKMSDITSFDFDDRDLLYQESFAYRINYFYKQVDANPHNEDMKKQLRIMMNYMEEFENVFYEKDFWYCEYDYVGIAKK